MKKRRVGTISMGILLVILGICLVYAQINSKEALGILINWWPVLFFMLGIEVLWYSYRSKEENPKIKYDIFSIFIIFLIVIVGIGIYGVVQVGIIPQVTSMMTAQTYMLQTPTEEILIDADIERIVVDSPARSHVNLRGGTEDTITVYGEAYVTADSRESAEKSIFSKMAVKRKVGNTLYLSFNSVLSGNGLANEATIEEFTVIIPGDRGIEIINANSLEVYADGLKNQISIESGGTTELKVPENGDFAITAYVNYEGRLEGNVDWDAVGTLSDVEDENGNANTNSIHQETTGKIIVGEGKCKINIVSEGSVIVNKF
ncbi:MAG: hypothetical protein PHI90_03500 [Clostridia bacterium]|nr:hypothetical protein [Clostridia bacterium]MDD4047882.1 hypothetical protein [Clostridia bacterium]